MLRKSVNLDVSIDSQTSLEAQGASSGKVTLIPSEYLSKKRFSKNELIRDKNLLFKRGSETKIEKRRNSNSPENKDSEKN